MLCASCIHTLCNVSSACEIYATRDGCTLLKVYVVGYTVCFFLLVYMLSMWYKMKNIASVASTPAFNRCTHSLFGASRHHRLTRTHGLNTHTCTHTPLAGKNSHKRRPTRANTAAPNTQPTHTQTHTETIHTEPFTHAIHKTDTHTFARSFVRSHARFSTHRTRAPTNAD